MNTKLNIKNRLCTMPFVVCLFMVSALGLTSCEDLFEQDSEYVIFDGDNALDNAADTIYSVIGVLNKLQAIADRTHLLGEVRGDLVDVTDATHAELRNVALFDIAEDNKYNNPRDYYAIINNCNYFIANVDTTIINNRNEKIFLREYAAIKGFRAWTYLQLALNYGSVPFVTDPILTKLDSEKDYPRYGIQEICNYFIQDLAPLVDVEMPGYGTIRSVDSRLLYFPIHLLLGELNLWAGNYKQAALSYYNYISKRNGMNSTYPIGIARIGWADNEWESIMSYSGLLAQERYSDDAELITMIPGDSIPSEGYYSELRELYNSSEENDYKASLTPSKSLRDLSHAQRFCYVDVSDGGEKDTLYAPEKIDWVSTVMDMGGDLRLFNSWDIQENFVNKNDEKVEYQTIGKHQTRNIHIYRRVMVYLRMAEALNRAGYPAFAYQILASGVNNNVIETEVIPHYSADSTFLRQFDFPNIRYQLNTPELDAMGSTAANVNTIGIHSRGSGWASANKYYQMPVDTLLAKTDSLAHIAWQQDMVEDMLVDEFALELAFEGTRFYDLMRVALRRGEPAYLADRIYARRGEQNAASMKGEIKTDLYNSDNWYLRWNGEIGLEPAGNK